MARMTKRQKEGKKISKKRAARKLRQVVLRRVLTGALLLLVLTMGVGGWWLWRSGEIGQQYDRIASAFLDMTADAGFVVDHIYLGGRKRIPRAEIEDTISVSVGDPIFSADPDDIRKRLELLPKVKYAQVERALPDRLHIQIVEREPIAVWQYKGKLELIDDEGVVIGGEDISAYSYLPLVVGRDAPEHTAELLKLLVLEPDLMRRVDAAIRVGERRWNLRFNNGVEVKLPAVNAKEAWHRLAELEEQDHLLQGNIISIDLRIGKHMYIKLPPDTITPENNNYKKETRA